MQDIIKRLAKLHSELDDCDGVSAQTTELADILDELYVMHGMPRKGTVCINWLRPNETSAEINVDETGSCKYTVANRQGLVGDFYFSLPNAALSMRAIKTLVEKRLPKHVQ